MTCPTCQKDYPPSYIVGHNCYLCVLKDYPHRGFFKRIVYSKAVAVSLALSTPLTVKQARKVVKKFGIDDMYRLVDLQNGKLVDKKPNSTFFKRVMEVES